MKTVADAAREYRARKKARFERAQQALLQIVHELGDRDSVLANRLRQIAQEGLER